MHDPIVTPYRICAGNGGDRVRMESPIQAIPLPPSKHWGCHVGFDIMQIRRLGVFGTPMNRRLCRSNNATQLITGAAVAVEITTESNTTRRSHPGSPCDFSMAIVIGKKPVALHPFSLACISSLAFSCLHFLLELSACLDPPSLGGPRQIPDPG